MHNVYAACGLVAVLVAIPASAQRSTTLELQKREVDRSASLGPASSLTSTGQVTIQASQKDAAALVVLGLPRGLKLEFSTPINKDAAQTDFLSLDGLATGMNAGLSGTWFLSALTPRAASGERAPGQAVCEKYHLPKAQTCSSGDMEKFLRARDIEDKALNRALDEFDSDFFANGSVIGLSIKAKSAYQEFKFFDMTGVGSARDRFGGSLALSLFSVKGANRLSLGATGERAYKASNQVVQKCAAINGSSALESCESRPLGPPESSSDVVVRGEWRHLGAVGLSPVVSWRTRDRVVGFDLPVFFVSDSDGKLTGGIRAGWRSDDKFQVAAFVSKPLGLK